MSGLTGDPSSNITRPDRKIGRVIVGEVFVGTLPKFGVAVLGVLREFEPVLEVFGDPVELVF
jgi:hypothetical protein